MSSSKRRCFSLEEDLPALERKLKEGRYRLIVTDPVTAFTGAIDSHKNAEIRGLLAPLAELAARYRVAIVAVTHLNKATNMPAVYRAMGSLAFVAAPRAVWAVLPSPQHKGQRFLLPVKLNLSANPGGLAYQIRTEGGNPVVAWEAGQIDQTPDEAMNPPRKRSGPRSESESWLKRQLSAGPRPSDDLIELGKQAGFSEKTLRRAARALGIESFKDATHNGKWFMRLPTKKDVATFEETDDSCQDSEFFPEDGHEEVGHLRESYENSVTTDRFGEDGQLPVAGVDADVAKFEPDDEVEI